MTFTMFIPLILLCIVGVSVKETININDMFIAGMIMLTIIYCTVEIVRAIRETKREDK